MGMEMSPHENVKREKKNSPTDKQRRRWVPSLSPFSMGHIKLALDDISCNS
jgi:hypothetical protein